MRNIIYALFVVLFPSVSMALEQTKTGFVYPLGTSSYSTGKGWWLSKDPDYFQGEYHLGIDMLASYGTTVYAIADGDVKPYSKNGWGNGNCALAIEHKTSTGAVFTAIYGHLLCDSLIPEGTGNAVAGRYIGRVGTWDDGDHVHFGIHPGPYNTIASSHWGRQFIQGNWVSPCTGGCLNTMTDPIAFIQNNAPSLKRKMGHSGTVYWYPPVDFCTNANQWYRMTPSGPVAADISICAEVPPMCPFDNQ